MIVNQLALSFDAQAVKPKSGQILTHESGAQIRFRTSYVTNGVEFYEGAVTNTGSLHCRLGSPLSDRAEKWSMR